VAQAGGWEAFGHGANPLKAIDEYNHCMYALGFPLAVATTSDA
jgi:hypothetical protein